MKYLWLLAAFIPLAQAEHLIVRPAEIHGVLVNPGMGITTFQRYNGEPLYPGLRWSEAGPTEALAQGRRSPFFPRQPSRTAAGIGPRSSPRRERFAGRFSIPRSNRLACTARRWPYA